MFPPSSCWPQCLPQGLACLDDLPGIRMAVIHHCRSCLWTSRRPFIHPHKHDTCCARQQHAQSTKTMTRGRTPTCLPTLLSHSHCAPLTMSLSFSASPLLCKITWTTSSSTDVLSHSQDEMSHPLPPVMFAASLPPLLGHMPDITH